MTDRAFRFGVVAGLARDAAEWTAIARRAEDLGYDTLLIPDTLNTLSPFPALATVAAATRRLRVGTYVLSAPNRPPGLVAWETASLDFLTGGRFELGIGAGRPGADRDATILGARFGSPADRLGLVAATIQAVKEARATGPRPVQRPHPPILVAASKPRMLRLAADEADIVALGLPPQAGPADLAATVATLREVAGDRFDGLELHLNTAAVATSAAEIPDVVTRMVGGDPRAMAAAGGTAFLIGTDGQIADVLLRRRDELGISYVGVSAMFMDRLASVVERLRGRD
jgi:probable F420-dependent oxidoreductase